MTYGATCAVVPAWQLVYSPEGEDGPGRHPVLRERREDVPESVELGMRVPGMYIGHVRNRLLHCHAGNHVSDNITTCNNCQENNLDNTILHNVRRHMDHCHIFIVSQNI